jgi:hypothetical protein
LEQALSDSLTGFIELIRRGAEVSQNAVGHRQRDFSLSREDLIGARLAQRRGFV